MLIKLLILLFIPTFIFAADPPLTLYDEGTKQGVIFEVNCTGSGVSCTKSGIRGTLDISGGGVGVGTVNPGTAGRFTYYPTTGTTVDDQTILTLSGNNIGVGSIDPTEKLDVVGTAKMTGFKLTTSPTNGYVLTSDASGNGSWSAPTGGSSQWFTVAGVGIGTYDNVGIGTNNPRNKLSVAGTTAIGADYSTITASPANSLIVQGNFSVGTSNATQDPDTGTGNVFLTANTGNGIVLYDTRTTGAAQTSIKKGNTTNNCNKDTLVNSSGGNQIDLYACGASASSSIAGTSTADLSAITFTANSAAVISQEANSPMHFATNGTRAITISSSQNVAIANTEITPDASLEIVKNGAVDLFMASSSDSGDGDYLIVKNGGNVGIGSAIPPNKVYIAGTAEMQGFKLPGNGAASGFVLQSDGVGVGTWVAASTLATSGGAASAAGTNNSVQYNGGSSTFAGDDTKFGFNGTNVGIGTTSYLKRLNIVGNIGISTLANSSILRAVPASNVAFVTDGRVGIGTHTPSANLVVTGTIQTGNTSAGWQMTSTNITSGTSSNSLVTNNISSIDSTGITIKGRDASGGTPGPVTIRSGNGDSGTSGSSNLTINSGDGTLSGSAGSASATVRAGDQTNSSNTNPAGNLIIRPGGSNNATGGVNGELRISNTFRVSAGDFAALRDTACLSANSRVADCATSATNFVGVGIGTSAPATAQFGGIVSQAPFDGTYSPSAGWYVCTSDVTAGKVFPQSTPCPIGRQIGIITVGATSVGVGTYMITTIQGGGTITDNKTNVGINSSAPGARLDVQGGIRTSSTTVGKATCTKADGTQGSCTSVVDASGGCTCS